MKLNLYLRSLIRDPNGLYTPDSLEIPDRLSAIFRALLVQSDLAVRELGCSLVWEPSAHGGRVGTGDTIFMGGMGGTTVDLQTQTERLANDYIGGFHTHPYAEKYGRGYSIGPSNGDWMEWWFRPPRHRPFAVHAVASGTDLFVVVFRHVPVGQPVLQGVTADAGRLNDAVFGLPDRDQVDYDACLHGRNWVALRQFFDARAPKVRRWHEEDAHAMNIGMANANRCEYYRGRLAGGAVTLQLHSSRVLGNWFTTNLWASSNDSWMRWPF
jgi:hypothetical protein